MKIRIAVKSGLISWWMLPLVVLFLSGTAHSEPSKSQVTKMWEGQYKNKVLDLKPRGGQRTTNQLHNQHYLSPIGSCWDYDVTELQKCGCRLFEKASVCCKKGSSSDCEIRIGNSRMLDCSKFGKSKFGLSGDKEPAACRERRMASDCFSRKDLTFGPGITVGPCTSSPYFICPQHDETMMAFLNKKCAPTPEDCGCTIVPECSQEEHLKCYQDWSSNKDAVECYTNPNHKTPYAREDCYKNLLKLEKGN
jgi:hypothetical protein